MSSLLTSQKIQKVTIHCSIFLICVTFNNLFPTSCLNSLLLFQNVSFFSNHFLHIASGLYFCLIIFCYQTKNVYSFLCNVSHKFPPQIKVQNNHVNPIFFTGSNALQPVPSFNTHTAWITLAIRVSIWKPHWLALIIKADSLLAFHVVLSFISFYPFYLSYLPHSRQTLHSWYQVCEHFGVFSFPYAHITFCFA